MINIMPTYCIGVDSIFQKVYIEHFVGIKNINRTDFQNKRFIKQNFKFKHINQKHK